MKYIFKNLRIFIKNERIIFVILVLCSFVTAFVLNFAYGTYKNSVQENFVADESMKQFTDSTGNETETRPSPFRLTKGDLRAFLSGLKPTTLDNVDFILSYINQGSWAASCGGEFVPQSGLSFTVTMYTGFRDGEFAVPQSLVDEWLSTGMIKDGRWFTERELKGSEKLVVLNGEPGGGGTPEFIKEYKENHKVGDTVKINGENYEIIGLFNNGLGFCVPLGNISDAFELTNINIVFKTSLTRRQYNDLKNTAERIIPGQLYFPELQLPDDETILLNNNIILISALIAVLSAMNFAMLYLFILRKRKNTLAVMRLCGATCGKAALIYLGECLILFVPSYWLGTLCFDLVMNSTLSDIFPYMSELVDLSGYAVIFGIYFIIMTIVLSALVAMNVRFKISDSVRRGKI